MIILAVVMLCSSVTDFYLQSRLAGIHEQEGHERLFKDEADLTVAVKYMKENGNFGTKYAHVYFTCLYCQVR